MNKNFDFGRFGRYFAYDIRRAWYNCGISALCVGLFPIIAYIFGILFYLVGVTEFPTVHVTAVMIPIAVIFYVLFFPGKLYGEVTDRRAGSNYLMLPASRCEKFTSMLLMLILVLPLAISVIFCISDLLLSIIPTYGGTLWSMIDSLNIVSSNPKIEGNGTLFTETLFALTVFEQFANFVLFFLLGALIFKRKKTGKTILCYMLIMTILILIIIFAANLVGNYDVSYDMSDRRLAIISNVINLAVAVLLGFFVYRRLKKIAL